MLRLNVNIDHVATVRQARGGTEPDPVTAAVMAELAGASGIVCHLREDRRHVNDRDVRILKEVIQTKMDLEMAANEEIIKIALDLKPDMVTIVPEKRRELTTESGLDIVGEFERYKALTERFHEKRIYVSFFIEPEEKDIEATTKAGADMVEFHTGIYANAREKTQDARHKTQERIQNSEFRIQNSGVSTLMDSKQLLRVNYQFNDLEKIEFDKLRNACTMADKAGLEIAAGHGLNYFNVKPICHIPEIAELSIGHSIISRAVYVGIQQAVREMLEIFSIES
jgi:pyridoxine 5-phosphate synthase